jgi:hypothetical protein
MITGSNIPLDLLFYADHGVSLIGQQVRFWHPFIGKPFMEQTDEAARPKLVLSGKQPVIRFSGKQCLNFRGFGVEKGPHSFFFVCRTKRGTLLDSQANDILVPAEKMHWQVYEVIQDSPFPINETVLGADYYGKAEFLHGDIAAFGYKRGILQKGQREYMHKLLEKKLGEAEKGFWSIHIPKPKWWPN